MPEEMQRDEAPVEPIKPEMLGQPVTVLGDPRVQALDIFDMSCRSELKFIGELLQHIVFSRPELRHGGNECVDRILIKCSNVK